MHLVMTLLRWILGGLCFGVIIFLVSLYIRGAFRWRALFRIEGPLAPGDAHFSQVLTSLSHSRLATGNIVGFWHRIDDIQQARLAAIAAAQHSIQFETFMMTPGKRADNFANAIAQRAIEGVTVQLLVDHYGAKAMCDRYWQRLRSAGAQVIFFNPFDWRAPADYAGRTHRKLLIIDSVQALIGGAGISNLWDGIEKEDDTQPWFDVEIAIAGKSVNTLSAIFQSHWQGHRLSSSSVSTVNAKMIEPHAANPDHNHSKLLITPGNKPSYRHSAVRDLKLTLITCAQQKIWLSSPYFLPNQSARQLLITAQKRGVDVRILTTSERSDKKPVYYASCEVYGPLLAAGIKIFEYQPSMLHAKLLLIDDTWVNTGSANFDYRSFLHNDELDITTNSPKLINKIIQTFEHGFANSHCITLERWQQRSWLKHRLLGNIVRLAQWQL